MPASRGFEGAWCIALLILGLSGGDLKAQPDSLPDADRLAGGKRAVQFASYHLIPSTEAVTADSSRGGIRWGHSMKDGLARLAWGMLAAGGIGLATVLWFARRGPGKSSIPLPLFVSGCVRIGPRSGLTLVRVGQQNVLVGYDPRGIQQMLVLPADFEELLSESCPREITQVFPQREFLAVEDRGLELGGG